MPTNTPPPETPAAAADKAEVLEEAVVSADGKDTTEVKVVDTIVDADVTILSPPETKAIRQQFDQEFLKSVTWNDVHVEDGILRKIFAHPIEAFRSKDLRFICSALSVKGVKNVQKHEMIVALTEKKHERLGIVAEVKPPPSIAKEVEHRKRVREEKEVEVIISANPELALKKQEVEVLKKQNAREADLHELNVKQAQAQYQNTLIDSYAKVQRSLIDAVSYFNCPPLSATMQCDFQKFIEIKRKIVDELEWSTGIADKKKSRKSEIPPLETPAKKAKTTEEEEEKEETEAQV